MKARILEKSEEPKWDKFIETHSLSTIHQTSAWGHFQEKIPGRDKYWIIVLEENDKIIGGTMLIRHALPKGYCWLYAARGPLIKEDQMEELLKTIKPIAKKEKAIFLRVDPPTEKPIKFKGFKETHSGFQPEHTLIIDLTKSEEEILKQMKPKGRYNIRLAEKKGVKIHKSNDIDSFYSLLEQTTHRDKFSGHDKNFYQKMLDKLPNSAILYTATYNEKPIAGIIVTSFKDTATYYYGASGNEYRNVMAPYLLQWHAIKEAKDRKLKYYDFFGIAPENTASHPWAGVTEFKKKFGGKPQTYAPPQEYSFKPLLHFLYKLYKKFT